MKNKGQIFMIHGGMTFKNRRDYLHYLKNRGVSIKKKTGWYGDYLDKKLGKDFEIIRPRMPLQDNAKYEEWKIHFERFFPYFKNNIILIGVSLGGIFLAKYLSEHAFPKKLAGMFLICPPFDDAIKCDDLVGGFRLKSNLSLLEKNAKHLYLLFSKDDIVVPPSQALKYKNKLKKANIIIYKNKNGHFNVSQFPEIVKMIKEMKKVSK